MVAAERAGAAGYLTKDATGEPLLTAIRDVAAGRTVLDAAVQRRLVDRHDHQRQDDGPLVEPALPNLATHDEDKNAGYEVVDECRASRLAGFRPRRITPEVEPRWNITYHPQVETMSCDLRPGKVYDPAARRRSPLPTCSPRNR